jgi:hypothetical protein
VSEVSPGHLKLKFQRLLKKFFMAPNQTTLWSSLYIYNFQGEFFYVSGHKSVIFSYF